MLFQSDQGSTPLPQVVASFDPAEYVSQLEREPESEPVDLSAFDGAPDLEGSVLVPAESRTDEKISETELRGAFAYACRIVEGVRTHLSEIDERIRSQADNWRLERMPTVDRNILRLAIYELTHEADIPKLVVLDEAVELAKRFGSEQSGRFVNGLLDGILKKYELPGSRR